LTTERKTRYGRVQRLIVMGMVANAHDQRLTLHQIAVSKRVLTSASSPARRREVMGLPWKSASVRTFTPIVRFVLHCRQWSEHYRHCPRGWVYTENPHAQNQSDYFSLLGDAIFATV